MSFAIAPNAAPQTQAPVPLAQLLVPGATVEARVLQHLSAHLVRMVIAATAVDVASPMHLPIGARLRLAVSQGEGGLHLTVLSSQLPSSRSSGAQGAPVPASPAVPSGAQGALQGLVLRPVGLEPESAPLQRPAPASASPQEAALAQAAQQAASRQGALSPLFANLGVALASGKLPPGVLQAAFSLMTLRPQLTEQLSAADVRAALQRSGLFLESSLGQGRAPTTLSPDLKAALAVLRQSLSQWLGGAGKLPAAFASASGMSAQPAASATPQLPGAPSVPPQTAALPAVDAPPLSAVADADVQEIVIPRAPAGMPARPHDMPSTPRTVVQSSVGAVLTFVQEIEQNVRDALARPGALQTMNSSEGAAQRPPFPTTAQSAPLPQGPATPVPPPPFRGADPSPQPVAMATIAPDDTPLAIGHRLFEEADAALARQTLLQIASMPEASVQQGQRGEQTRLAFEIPFATPQGTAVAQFEVERDGRKDAPAEEGGRVWRARFSLNIEPAGPVHAVVSLAGGHTTVRLWAERAETAAWLRDGAPLLSHALREAELEPGDITIGGVPPSAPRPSAGHFWDRAS